MSDKLYQSVILYMTKQTYAQNLTKAEKRKVRETATQCILDNNSLLDARNTYNPHHLYVSCLSSREITVSWRDIPQSFHEYATEVEIFVIMVDFMSGKIKRVYPSKRYNFALCTTSMFLPVSGEYYEIHANFVRAITVEGKTYWLILGKGKSVIQSKFNLSELYQLKMKAVSFLKGKKQVVNVLYRNRPAAYFQDILQHRNGDMVPYKKDFNGDPASPINLTVDGLFFSANTLKNGKLPDSSPFGDTRFVVPVYRLINANKNFYFADFYCHHDHHYVTVVVTTPGSNTDLFCATFLPSLDLFHSRFHNPFLWFENEKFYIGADVWVEIYYTDVINLNIERLNPLCYFTRVSGKVGKGVSSLLGIRKRQDCSLCNLYK